MRLILWSLTLTWTLVAARCLPAATSALPTGVDSVVGSDSSSPAIISSVAAASSSAAAAHRPPVSEEILRRFNLSKEDLESASMAVKNRPHFRMANSMVNRQENLTVTQKQIRQRDASLRRQEIFRQIIGFVSKNGRPPSTINMTLLQKGEEVAEMLNHSGVIGVNIGRLRYIQPSCEIPKHTDEELWASAGSLNLYFNVSNIQPREGYQLYVSSAKLRLYKYSEGETHKVESELCSENWPASLNDGPIHSSVIPFFDPSSDEDKIRISAHNYTRPLKKHRGHKRKLLDSHMALTKEEGFMELDVKLAVRWWLVPGGRNFGLVVEVEDTEGQRKPTNSFFRSRDCTPLADGSIRTDEVQDPTNITSPVLEITLLEIPEGKSLMEQFSSPHGSDSRKRIDDDLVDDEHQFIEEEEHPRRHRHQIHHQYEEQADDASRTQHFPPNKHPANHHIKHKSHSRITGIRTPPLHTLPILEDHDLLSNTDVQNDEDDKDFNRQNVDVLGNFPHKISKPKALHPKLNLYGHSSMQLWKESKRANT